MNHRGTEDAEKKKKNDEVASSNGRLSCFILFIIIFAVTAILCWGSPLMSWVFHYIQWQIQDIEKYAIELTAGFMIPDYLEPTQLDDGTLSFNHLLPKDESLDIIDLLFQDAFSSITNPFCSVAYNSEYGFPERMMCYEGAGVIVKYFKPTNNHE